MMTFVALVVVVLVCRRPIAWIGVRLVAFTIGFAIGWRWMERR